MKNKNQLPKFIKILKIYDIVACIAILALFGFNMILSWNLAEGESLPYFNQHFLTPIGFVLMGTVAASLPKINRTKAGDDRGDRMMAIVGVLFIVMAVVTLIFSFF